MADATGAADTSIVIPAYNEAAAIGAVVGDLLTSAGWREILVVDDGSTDDTGAQAAAAGARVIRHPFSRGPGAGVKTGIRNATGDVILVMDADGQMDPLYIPAILGKLSEGYAMVV